jgi:hypothetical protein
MKPIPVCVFTGVPHPFLGAAHFVSGGSLRRVFNILVRVYNTLRRMYDMLIRVYDAPVLMAYVGKRRRTYIGTLMYHVLRWRE